MGRRPVPRHRRPHQRRGLRILAWTTAALVVLGLAGAGAVLHRLNANITSVDIDSALGDDRPAAVDNGAMNILLLGSDSRSGDKGAKSADPGRSDTAMVLHVYRGRQKAALVSIPRDTLVTRPACTTASGRRDPGGTRLMFNESYAVGGAACAVSTVEKMSGLRMDHYIELNFGGFAKVIDALGGITLTTTKAVDDPSSHLKLSAGTHKLNGTQALGLVRTRKTVGDGGDLGRIQLQQAFLKALLHQVRDDGTLTSPTRLLAVADAATKSMTTDSKLADASSLMGLVSDLKGIGSSELDSLTLPVAPDTRDPNRVVPLSPEAGQVWQALRADRPVPAKVRDRSMGDKGSAGAIVRQAAPAPSGPAAAR
ncbi:LCP family protein [Streptomyces erythrochromogenes]|uniref:LCP family protein n=1 Tax=Streptomyces erythrochromogenes TaxID=285574 RepID=UPI003429F90F